MYEPTGRHPNLAFLWPAFAAASVSEIASLIATQFVDLAIGSGDSAVLSEPKWATPNHIALELRTLRLREFTTARSGVATLLCAPLTLHGPAIADLAPGHSLVAALCNGGLQRVFVTDWRSADADMRFLGVDDYLANLNVVVDQLGGHVDLVGLCQGGWMALLNAARFPTKVRKLVLAGAPIDIAAGRSGVSALADASPLAVFHELVNLGDGRVLGHKVFKFWGPESIASEDVHRLLQTPEPIESPAFAQLEALFQDWYAWTMDLPGAYYLEVVEKVYKRNELATGHFVALGQTIDLATVRAPIFLLAARDDELVTPAQLFATEHLVSTSARNLRREMAPCRHVGLFVGKATLEEFWPRIVRWIVEPEIIGAESGKTHANRERNVH